MKTAAWTLVGLFLAAVGHHAWEMHRQLLIARAKTRHPAGRKLDRRFGEAA